MKLKLKLKLKLRWVSRMKLEMANRKQKLCTYPTNSIQILGHPRFQFGFRLAMEVDIDISYLSLLNEKCSKYEIKKKHSVSFFFMWGPSFCLPYCLPDGLWDGVTAAAVGVEVRVGVGVGRWTSSGISLTWPSTWTVLECCKYFLKLPYCVSR